MRDVSEALQHARTGGTCLKSLWTGSEKQPKSGLSYDLKGCQLEHVFMVLKTHLEFHVHCPAVDQSRQELCQSVLVWSAHVCQLVPAKYEFCLQ